MLSIKTRFTPLRMLVGQKEPVIMEVLIKHDEEQSQLANISVKTPSVLCFDRDGLVREHRKRTGPIKPGVEKVIPIMIYCKHNVEEGVYDINVRASIHPERYDKVVASDSTTAKLRVI